jgi:NitT/TauT family transport system substrate-binding protein
VEAIVAQRPQAKLDKKVLRGQIESLRGFFHLPVAAGETLGAPVPADWSEAVKTLSQANLIKAGADAQNFYVPGLVRPTPAISAAK